VRHFNRATIAVSMAGASLLGCTTPEQPPAYQNQAEVAPEDDPTLRGRVPIDQMVPLPRPLYTPQDCTAAERKKIASHVKTGDEFTAEFYVPNSPDEVPAVAVREKYSNPHNGAGLYNPIVLRCGGKVVEYAAIWFLDGPQDPSTDRDQMSVMSAEEAVFFDGSERGISPSKTSTRDIDALGHFATLDVEMQRHKDSVLVNLTDGEQKLGYS